MMPEDDIPASPLLSGLDGGLAYVCDCHLILYLMCSGGINGSDMFIIIVYADMPTTSMSVAQPQQKAKVEAG